MYNGQNEQTIYIFAWQEVFRPDGFSQKMFQEMSATLNAKKEKKN